MTAELLEVGWSDAQADCCRVFEENSHPMWVVEADAMLDVNRAARGRGSMDENCGVLGGGTP